MRCNINRIAIIFYPMYVPAIILISILNSYFAEKYLHSPLPFRVFWRLRVSREFDRLRNKRNVPMHSALSSARSRGRLFNSSTKTETLVRPRPEQKFVEVAKPEASLLSLFRSPLLPAFPLSF